MTDPSPYRLSKIDPDENEGRVKSVELSMYWLVHISATLSFKVTAMFADRLVTLTALLDVRVLPLFEVRSSRHSVSA